MAQLNSLGVLGNASVAGDLKIDGVTTHNNGHIYLTGSVANSSTGNTTQLVFGTQNSQHIVLSSNSGALVINPSTSSYSGQIVLSLGGESSFPYGVSLATKAKQDESGNNIKTTYACNLTYSGSSLQLVNKNGNPIGDAITIQSGSGSGTISGIYVRGTSPIVSSSGTGITNSGGTVTLSHSTDSGYKHIPSGGSAGQFLGWSADGTATWVNNPNTNTTYSFSGGTNGFTVTPSGGTAIAVTVTPSITNNITGSGTSGYLTKFNGNNTITNGPVLSSAISSQSQTTKFLREDGTWAAPSYTANTDTKVTQTSTTNSANYEVLFSATADDTTRTEAAGKSSKLLFNPSTGFLRVKSDTNPSLVVQNSDMDISVSTISDQEQSSLYFWDKNSHNIGYIQSYQDADSDGTVRLTLGATRYQENTTTTLYSYLTLNLTKNGTRTAVTNTNLRAIKAGDTYVEAQNSNTECRILLDSGNSTKHGLWSSGYYTGSAYSHDPRWILYRSSDGHIHSDVKIYGAVYNDYAEYRETEEEIEPGRVITEVGNGKLVLATKRLMRGCEVVSDTFGFAIGESKKCKTPTAVSGRVLVYPYESLEEFKTHIGWSVCSGPDGTVSIMTEEEERLYSSRIIGTISEVPDYDIWYCGQENNPGQREVKGRVWIRVR